MTQPDKNEVRQAVRKNYGAVTQAGSSACGCSVSSCCAPGSSASPEKISLVLGYSSKDVAGVPAGANMGLGCGNPQAIASLKPGEIVLDLGSGGGFDCFLAAKAVGATGRVIGVDMTPGMVSKARENAAKAGFMNVEFRLGEIEHLPMADKSVDVIVSNCVINLSPEKQMVFAEAFRALKPGGRLAISDVVATAALPEEIKDDLALYAGCVAGASLIGDVEDMLRKAGFGRIRIETREESREFIREWAPGRHIEEYVVSATIEAMKP